MKSPKQEKHLFWLGRFRQILFGSFFASSMSVMMDGPFAANHCNPPPTRTTRKTRILLKEGERGKVLLSFSFMSSTITHSLGTLWLLQSSLKTVYPPLKNMYICVCPILPFRQKRIWHQGALAIRCTK